MQWKVIFDFRYFRFYGRIADCADNHETSTLDAIADNAEGMSRISGERIWYEYKRILTGKFALSLVHKMSEANLNTHIGLPAEVNFEEMENVKNNINISGNCPFSWQIFSNRIYLIEFLYTTLGPLLRQRWLGLFSKNQILN